VLIIGTVGGVAAVRNALILEYREMIPMSTNGSLNRKLRMALVGGGQGAFIGRVHATAAVLDNRAALVAGCLSSDPAKAKASPPTTTSPPSGPIRLDQAR
jgi:hypothetical protein